KTSGATGRHPGHDAEPEEPDPAAPRPDPELRPAWSGQRRTGDPPRMVVVRNNERGLGYPVSAHQGCRRRGVAGGARTGSGHDRGCAPAADRNPAPRTRAAAVALAMGGAVRARGNRHALAAAVRGGDSAIQFAERAVDRIGPDPGRGPRTS